MLEVLGLTLTNYRLAVSDVIGTEAVPYCGSCRPPHGFSRFGVIYSVGLDQRPWYHGTYEFTSVFGVRKWS